MEHFLDIFLAFQYNIMRSQNQLCDGSNLIETISYHNSSQGWLSYLSPNLLNLTFGTIFQINLSYQPFELTYAINLSTVSRACGTSLPLTNMHMYEGVLLPTEVCMIQVINFLADCPFIEAWNVLFLNTLWWRCEWKPCWIQLGLLPYINVSFIFYNNVRILTGITKASWWIDQWPLGLTST